MLSGGFKLGRIFGIRIDVDWSWFLIFLLVTWNLASSVFPRLHPDWSPALNWGVGLAASLLFFASVLGHELAHSLVAIARGLPVRRIMLHMFGGVSNLEREPSSPATEFLITVVGPLTSLGLGVIFTLIGGLFTLQPAFDLGDPEAALSRLGPLATLFLWLGPINIALAVFNLIPGFPLDGGRLLRSLLWAITNNLRQATCWSSWVGQGIAWLFIVGGIAMMFGLSIPFFGDGFIGGLWLTFIGWFLNNAAVQSYQQVVVHDMLEGVPVARLMQADTPTVPPTLRLNRLVEEFLRVNDERTFAVVDGDWLIGLVTLEDVRKVPREAWETTPVSEVMTPLAELEAITPREDATQAFDKLARQEVRQMPVVQDGHLVGMLRRRDILRWLQLQSEFAAR
ncbi:MAG: site-2 protease family protein [Anaerolineales bacterium]